MKIKMAFDGSSFCVGLLASAVGSHQISAWWLLAIPLLVIDTSGPRLRYSSENGWEFKKWASPE